VEPAPTTITDPAAHQGSSPASDPPPAIWSDRLAVEIEAALGADARARPIVCASGISPSGPIHMGNLREVFTTHLVAEALRARGHDVVHLHSWDDYDRLRKVPAGVDASFAEHIGRPLAGIPDPWDEDAGSYAEHWMRQFTGAMRELGIEMREVRQSVHYPAGTYNARIRRAMEAREQIFDTLAAQQTAGRHDKPLEERRGEYFPFKPFCETCGRDDTQVTAWDGSVATYRCRHGHDGTMSLADGVPVALDAGGFDRHTFLCGQSGSGKTYALGVVLDRLLASTSLRIVILDPNSDFVSLGRVREGTEADAAARHREATARLRIRSAGTGPDRLHLAFPELSDEERGALLRLDPVADREEYAALLELLQERNPASLAEFGAGGSDDERRLAQRATNIGLDRLGIWSRGDAGSVLDDLAGDARVVVVDLGSLPTQVESALAAEAVLAALWRRREKREPVLIVIDEAHNVCPAVTADPLIALARDHVVRIAAEGRKFGLHLLLCTQRPQKLPENALTQCDNLVLMRLNARGDLAFLEDVFSFVPAGLLGLASGFAMGEALVAGKIAPDPLLMRFGRRVSEEGGSDVPATWAG
jgi:hypothetical protein